MPREVRIPAPLGFPLFGWTRESIKQYLTEHPLRVGDPMILYNAHGGLHRYQLASVVNPSTGPQRRVVLSRPGDSGGTSFHRTGINAFMPKGRTVMLPPVPALMPHLTSECDVVLEVALYATETMAEAKGSAQPKSAT